MARNEKINKFMCPHSRERRSKASNVFEKNIEQIDNDLPKGKESRDAAIKKELLNLEKIVSKLGKEYTSIILHSMKSFKYHVSKAHNSVLVDFIFPLSIPGLSE